MLVSYLEYVLRNWVLSLSTNTGVVFGVRFHELSTKSGDQGDKEENIAYSQEMHTVGKVKEKGFTQNKAKTFYKLFCDRCN